VNAKQAYEVQMLEKEIEETNCCYKELWTWQVPLKIQLFFFVNARTEDSHLGESGQKRLLGA
jgi:hypothetical protein